MINVRTISAKPFHCPICNRENYIPWDENYNILYEDNIREWYLEDDILSYTFECPNCSSDYAEDYQITLIKRIGAEDVEACPCCGGDIDEENFEGYGYFDYWYKIGDEKILEIRYQCEKCMVAFRNEWYRVEYKTHTLCDGMNNKTMSDLEELNRETIITD